jgi:hypothetical protein
MKITLAITVAITAIGIYLTASAFAWAGWQFALGFSAGAAFIYIMVRINYGFWPDPID